MARQLAKLSARKVATVTTPGRHSDGGGLYLVVDKSGAKRWVFLFRWKVPGAVGPGRLREKGLGSSNAVSLARAREKAAEARAMLADRIDPIAARQEVVVSAVPTFGEVADEFVDTKTVELRSKKSVARLKLALNVYAEPLRAVPINVIEVDDVLKVLQPIWFDKPETAHNVRTYVEAVLDAAKARGHRFGDNPARWRGHLDHLLPKRQKLARGHHAALPYPAVPAFLLELRRSDSVSAAGLEFLILTAARSGEVLGARWDEMDLDQLVWTVPAERMKAGREHRVPLTARAVELVRRMELIRTSDYVFPGQKSQRPLSGMAFEMLLRRMKRDTITVHGFRSSFRDYAGEETDSPREVAEAALAHQVGDQTERAYRRSDSLEKRRKLMLAWQTHCISPSQQDAVTQ